MTTTRRQRVLVALAILLALVGAAATQVGPIDAAVERSSTVDHLELRTVVLPRATSRFDAHDVVRGGALPFAVLSAGTWAAVLVALWVLVVRDDAAPGRRATTRAVVRGPPGTS